MTHFTSLGQKSKNNLVQVLVQMRTRKFASEIYWPLCLGSNIGHWLWGMQLQSYIWPQRLLAELKDKWESQLAPYGMSALAPIWRSRETDFLSIRAWPSCSRRPLRHEAKLDSHNQDFWNTVHYSGRNGIFLQTSLKIGRDCEHMTSFFLNFFLISFISFKLFLFLLSFIYFFLASFKLLLFLLDFLFLLSFIYFFWTYFISFYLL